jgi:hypothetical protein
LFAVSAELRLYCWLLDEARSAWDLALTNEGGIDEQDDDDDDDEYLDADERVISVHYLAELDACVIVCARPCMHPSVLDATSLLTT